MCWGFAGVESHCAGDVLVGRAALSTLLLRPRRDTRRPRRAITNPSLGAGERTGLRAPLIRSPSETFCLPLIPSSSPPHTHTPCPFITGRKNADIYGRKFNQMNVEGI